MSGAAGGQAMTPVELHGVALDRCYPDALVWFDATELDRTCCSRPEPRISAALRDTGVRDL